MAAVAAVAPPLISPLGDGSPAPPLRRRAAVTTPSLPRPERAWPWWPLLPLYPYGQRPTLVRELEPGRIWSFEQLHGIWYVAVPIRMTVIKVEQGLLLYAPLPPTPELLDQLRRLEAEHGPVCSLVLPTASGLEHKLPLPAMARAFPGATVWVTPEQWSFPFNLPASWLGFPSGRTRVLFADGLPHGEELDWIALGPLNLGLGRFLEVACYQRSSGTLLLTDGLVSIPAEPPEVFALDPTPLLFHGRDRGEEPLLDTPAQRRRGWQRIVLFASYLGPDPLRIRPLGECLRQALAPGLRSPRAHFGFFPFAWQPGWQEQVQELLATEALPLAVAPVLERLVFPRCRGALVAWIRQLAGLEGLRQVVPCHYAAPVVCTSGQLAALADQLAARPWAPDGGPWRTLSQLDHWLVRTGIVPGEANPSMRFPG